LKNIQNSRNEIKNTLNQFGKQKERIFFIIDYNLNNYYIKPLKDIDDDILYYIDGFTNCQDNNISKDVIFQKEPMKFDEYKKKFNLIQKQIKEGNTYLLNLTAETKIKTNLTIKEIYHTSKSKFKIYKKDEFVCFSPERFINIKNNTIYTYPMKGTINSDIKDAKNIILNDKKEIAEHTMAVDLLRNDLGRVSKNVVVEKFRYIDEIVSNDKKLLQVSSKISGKLDCNWQNRLGDILLSMLPAGSISGTPKQKTIEIIENTEGYDRGYFTGVCGYFDGESLDSAIMIRFIQQQQQQQEELIYKSGGGITISSEIKSEYQELIDKVYLCF
jgi:para-aminobenzoate synthetase component 1